MKQCVAKAIKHPYFVHYMALPTTTDEIWQELRLRLSDKELVNAVYFQLKTDTERSGLTLPFEEDLSANKWKHTIAPWLRQMDAYQIQSYLYLIDLPEKITQMLAHSDEFFLELADAILYRELVKVYYRITYSSKPNGQ